MSVQFGRWSFDDETTAPDYIEKVNATLAPYGPDSNESYSKGGVKILYRAFYTTKESRLEAQPHSCASGAVITWDGRLDNRRELVGGLRNGVTLASTDLAIVAAAYEKWGTDCFAKLIGDWALSIWNPTSRSLILAKDPIGARHLYYSFDANNVTWSTILDPLVLFAGKTFELCEEYIAGWLAIMFPAVHLTPYHGIHSVPSSSVVLLRPGQCNITKYWDFDPSKKVRYRTDAEYEEHFRAVFATAVRRTLRSDRPVLAELSGGMDSSSIVCMADTIITRGDAETPRLDTISWYDDSYDHVEPDTNERRYFTRVEQKRGRTGYHINIGELRRESDLQDPFTSDFKADGFAVIPDSNRSLSEVLKRYATYMTSQGYRVTLSGIGGGEVTGDGVPTPTPELQDLLARARLFTLTRQLNAWATKMTKRRLPLLWEAVRGFLFRVLWDESKKTLSVPWIESGFIRRNRTALCAYPSRLQLIGPLPSFQHCLRTLNADRRLLADWTVHSELLREVRFPYFDRHLLEFMYAIPREQIVRVGQRRSLMKRALAGVVPDELLNRRRKAFVPREPPKDAATEWPVAMDLDPAISSSAGIIEQNRFLEALQRARCNEEVLVDILKRTVTLELWLRHLMIQRVLVDPLSTKKIQGCALSMKAENLRDHTDSA